MALDASDGPDARRAAGRIAHPAPLPGFRHGRYAISRRRHCQRSSHAAHAWHVGRWRRFSPARSVPARRCASSTGAPVPEGADAILIQEDAEASGDAAHSAGERRGGTLRRAAGLDFKTGASLLAAGRDPRRTRARVGRRDGPRHAAGPPQAASGDHLNRRRTGAPGNDADWRPDHRGQCARPRRLCPFHRRRTAQPRHRPRRSRRHRAGDRPSDCPPRRRAGDARRCLGRRSRSGRQGARRPRHDARLLADRDAAGQAADVRADRRYARAGPAGNPVSTLVCALLFLTPAGRRIARPAVARPERTGGVSPSTCRRTTIARTMSAQRSSRRMVCRQSRRCRDRTPRSYRY